MIKISGVSHTYRVGFWLKRVQVLSNIHLEIGIKGKGSVTGFLGANGAGKTTLIQLIMGLRNPTAGTIEVDGIPSREKEARAKIGYLPERPYFYEHLSSEGILKYFGSLSGLSSHEIEEKIPVVLERVGLTHARKLELKRFSKGMLQRIGIAQAILHDPSLLVLDEPMSGLDPLGRKEMRELIIDLASSGKTVFFSSHVIPDVESICDSVVLIQKGKIVGSGRVSDLLMSKGQTEIFCPNLDLDEWKKKSVKLSSKFKNSIIESKRVADGVLIVYGPEHREEPTEFICALGAQGIDIRSVVPHRESLERLFL